MNRSRVALVAYVEGGFLEAVKGVLWASKAMQDRRIHSFYTNSGRRWDRLNGWTS